MSDPRLDALDALVRALEDLLDALGGPRAGARPWERCQAAYERFRALQEADAVPLSDAARARLRDAQRLHAVAAVEARRTREGLAGELEQVRRARGALRAASAERAPGPEPRACDLAG